MAINPDHRDDLDEVSESPEPEAPKRPNLSQRWRKRAVRYGSKVVGQLNDIDVERVEREHRGDPFGPTPPVASVQGYASGGKQARWDSEPVHELDEHGKVKEAESKNFPRYDADDTDVIFKLFRIRI